MITKEDIEEIRSEGSANNVAVVIKAKVHELCDLALAGLMCKNANIHFRDGIPVQIVLKAMKSDKETTMELTREDMPDHPRFKWDNGIWFNYDGDCWQSIRVLMSITADHIALEHAVAIAYMHFMKKWDHKESDVDAYDKAQKWLSLLAPKPVFGKDWNGWSFVSEDKTEIFYPQEKVPNPSQPEIYKRVFRTVKVIE